MKLQRIFAATLLMAGTFQLAFAAEPAEPLSEPEFARGRILFLQCRACHAVDADEGEKIGPSLTGVFGRRAASLASFNGYSSALSKSGIVWNDSAMNQWLRDPAGMVPGNLMVYAGLASDADRSLLVRYLRRVTDSDGDK